MKATHTHGIYLGCGGGEHYLRGLEVVRDLAEVQPTAAVRVHEVEHGARLLLLRAAAQHRQARAELDEVHAPVAVAVEEREELVERGLVPKNREYGIRVIPRKLLALASVSAQAN